MNLNNIKPAKGSTHKVKRLGRGQGSGRGGTSTKGHKGAQSRSGYKSKPGFEGGQMPIQRRLPKFGFNNINRVEYKAVNLAVLDELVKRHNLTDIDVDTFVKYGLASKNDLIKVLATGEITVAINVTAHAFSKTAIEAIEAKQGKVTKL